MKKKNERWKTRIRKIEKDMKNRSRENTLSQKVKKRKHWNKVKWNDKEMTWDGSLELCAVSSIVDACHCDFDPAHQSSHIKKREKSGRNFEQARKKDDAWRKNKSLNTEGEREERRGVEEGGRRVIKKRKTRFHLEKWPQKIWFFFGKKQIRRWTKKKKEEI